MINPSLGYFPNDIPYSMQYPEWANTFGKFRWYDSAGNPRTLITLNDNWRTIFNIITSNTDKQFNYRFIRDIPSFTDEFISRVPEAWLRYQTFLELIIGNFVGTSPNDDMFNNKVSETIKRLRNNERENSTDINGTSEYSDTMGQREDTTNDTSNSDSETKARSINYLQGIQAYDNEINNDNIGELGNNFASGMNDSVALGNENAESETNFTQGEQNNSGNNEYSNTSKGNQKESENEIEERISSRSNYYMLISLLNTRMEHANKFIRFSDYFNDLFNDVEKLKPWYK